MEKLSEEALKECLADILRAIEVNSIMNAYTVENVVFGDLKVGDKVPFDKFVEELELRSWQPYSVRECIEGAAITAEETVAEHDLDFFFSECFIFHMNYVFDSAPQRTNKDDDEKGLRPFKKEGLNDYIMRLYPLFKSILQTEVGHNFYALASPFPDRTVQTACYEKIAKFLVAVMTRGLRQGGCVERYLKDVPYLPYYVKKLLKEKNGRRLLANSDTESLDFRLAYLSAIHFMNAEHTQLFERKAQKWAEEVGADKVF